MVRPWPIIGVQDVAASARWYGEILGCGHTHVNDPEFDQIVDEEGTIALCVHAWDAHGHPSLSSSAEGQAGKGLLLFFIVPDVHAAARRARRLTAITPDISHNSNTGAKEFALRDPDGYHVVVSGPPTRAAPGVPFARNDQVD